MGQELTSVRIKNFEAGALFENNIGVRDSFRYTNAVIAPSLFLDFLLENGLKIWKGTMTRDIIGIDFECGSRSYEEEVERLNKTRKHYIAEDIQSAVDKINGLLNEAEINKDKFIKKTKEEIREIFYRNGVTVKYVTKKKNGQIKKIEEIHYKMLYRSTGKAKKGSCVFIKDVDSYFNTNVTSVGIDNNHQCIAKDIDNYQLKNTMFDGQALIDSSIFPSWGNGYLLLRQHFCKMAAFSANIQEYYKDYFGDIYEYAQVEDMWGNKHFAKDIKLITTENAVKWTKFNVTYEQWAEKVRENHCNFGIVKTAHKSKLGEVQRMSYQMVNALDVNIMEQVMETSVEYIGLLKSDDDTFLTFLKHNVNFSNDFDVLVALVKQNPNFIRSEYFRSRRKAIIQAYTMNFKSGHINQNGDNLVIVGSPMAMLMCSVGLDPETDPTFQHEEGTIQCYTERFDDGEYLAEFRNPFNAKQNMGYLHNVKHPLLQKYFNIGKQCIAVNMVHTPFQDRN